MQVTNNNKYRNAFAIVCIFLKITKERYWSFLLGSRERKEKIELGIGFTLINKSVNEREIVPTAVIGFRVIETNKVCFRMSYTPFIRDGKYESWFGVSIGRNFSMK